MDKPKEDKVVLTEVEMRAFDLLGDVFTGRFEDVALAVMRTTHKADGTPALALVVIDKRTGTGGPIGEVFLSGQHGMAHLNEPCHQQELSPEAIAYREGRANQMISDMLQSVMQGADKPPAPVEHRPKRKLRDC